MNTNTATQHVRKYATIAAMAAIRRMQMKTRLSSINTVGAMLFMASSATVCPAAVSSLVDDFDINVNSTSSTWSYYVGTLGSMYLLPVNTRTVYDIFSPPDTPCDQRVWADTNPSWAYWMVGKNTTGATITAPYWGDILDWQPGTVMLHPGNPASGQNLLVSWLAPSDMSVDVTWTFTRISERGPGRTQYGAFGTVYRVTLRSGTGDTTLVDFSPAAAPGGVMHDAASSSFARLSVKAGDRLFWETMGFNNTGECDATGAAITVTESPPFTRSSLADDFNINVNNTNCLWSYGTVVPASNPFVMKLLDTNTKTMASIFSSDTALPVWGSTEMSWAYWMLGKNTGPAAISNLWGDTLDFQPGTIMLYPGPEGRNLLVSWLAPCDMLIDADWTFTRISARAPGSPWPSGPGTDYRVTLRGSTNDTTVVDFAGAARPSGTLYDTHSNVFRSLSVKTGDRLFWEIAGVGGNVDMAGTAADITITKSQPYTGSTLGDEFDINVNSTGSTWSYYVGTLGSMYLLPINTRTVYDIFAPSVPDTPCDQRVWADTNPSWAYWMVGKNTTGATITAPYWGDILDWQPGTVMLHPGNPTSGKNLLVCWLAPSDMRITANWTFTRISERGPGRTQYGAFGTVYRLTHRSGTNDTTLVEFSPAAAPGGVMHDAVSSSFTRLNVKAGDRLFWETMGFSNTGDCDATGAAITVTKVEVRDGTLISIF